MKKAKRITALILALVVTTGIFPVFASAEAADERAGGCSCPCHKTPGMLHVTPCCDSFPGDEKDFISVHPITEKKNANEKSADAKETDKDHADDTALEYEAGLFIKDAITMPFTELEDILKKLDLGLDIAGVLKENGVDPELARKSKVIVNSGVFADVSGSYDKPAHVDDFKPDDKPPGAKPLITDIVIVVRDHRYGTITVYRVPYYKEMTIVIEFYP